MPSAALAKLLKAAKNKNLSASQARKLNKQIKELKAKEGVKPKSTYDPAKSIAKRKARSGQAANRARRAASRRKHPIATRAGTAVGKVKRRTGQAARSAGSKIARNKGKVIGGGLIAAGTAGVVYEQTRRGKRKVAKAPTTPVAPKTKTAPKSKKPSKPKTTKAYKGVYGDAMRLGPEGGPSASFKRANEAARKRRAAAKKSKRKTIKGTGLVRKSDVVKKYPHAKQHRGKTMTPAMARAYKRGAKSKKGSK